MKMPESTMSYNRGKGGKGLGKGGAKRHRKVLRDNIQGITKPASASCSSSRCQAHLRPHLRGDTWRLTRLPRTTRWRCRNLYRACQEEDCDGDGCGVCVEEAGQAHLWLWCGGKDGIENSTVPFAILKRAELMMQFLIGPCIGSDVPSCCTDKKQFVFGLSEVRC
ncbi:hypothetical protein ACHAXR_008037 [Thalassiosira sp. AJA248-18]